MDHENGEKSSYVTFDGHTIVDANALLRKPKVQQVLARLAANRHLFAAHRGSGIALVRRMKTDQ
jgi:hypothetical protein